MCTLGDESSRQADVASVEQVTTSGCSPSAVSTSSSSISSGSFSSSPLRSESLPNNSVRPDVISPITLPTTVRHPYTLIYSLGINIKDGNLPCIVDSTACCYRSQQRLLFGLRQQLKRDGQPAAGRVDELQLTTTRHRVRQPSGRETAVVFSRR